MKVISLFIIALLVISCNNNDPVEANKGEIIVKAKVAKIVWLDRVSNNANPIPTFFFETADHHVDSFVLEGTHSFPEVGDDIRLKYNKQGVLLTINDSIVPYTGNWFEPILPPDMQQ